MRLIQTSINEDWRIYLVNANKGDVRFYMRVGKSPRSLVRGEKGTSWYFPIQQEELMKIENLLNEERLYVFFICGAKELNKDMAVCAVVPEKIKELLDFSFNGSSQNITVKYIRGKGYRVRGAIRDKEVIVNQNTIDSIFKEIG
jgi:hypothetical protein